MRAHASFTAIALLTLFALPGCDKPDVGARCSLKWNSHWQEDGTPPPPTPASVQANTHYFESGNLACDDLVCLVSHAPASSKYGSCSEGACGYCSKPCVSDRDCYTSDTGLKCEKIVLDDEFMAILDTQNPELLDRYLGEIRSTSYCVVPAP